MSIFMRRRVLPAMLLVTLAGCASFSDDHGFGQVRDIAQQRLGKEVSWTHTEAERVELQQTIDQLLQKPLSVDDAVQVALLNNRSLQAEYEELGIAEANLVQAGRLANPGFSFSHTRDGGDIKIERSFSLAIMQLLTLPVSAKIEQRQFQHTKLTVANQVLQVAAATRNAYYQSVAANQSIGYQEQVESAASAGSELATKMAKAGNFNQLLAISLLIKINVYSSQLEHCDWHRHHCQLNSHPFNERFHLISS
ncbi:TolC family protein [Paraherbaspirillum soli]|uniref:TolC family protein n=1 Tax=Paraherbaspirillum soli TaxID=631222 RepID=A0ABW0MAA9_9BURK